MKRDKCKHERRLRVDHTEEFWCLECSKIFQYPPVKEENISYVCDCGFMHPTKKCPKQDKLRDWEKDLKLYLTSAGDRRRTIAFIKNLLANKDTMAFDMGYETGQAEYKQKLLKRVDKLKKGKIPWQALQFEDSCLECGAKYNREWIDNKCLEIAEEALAEYKQKLIKRIRQQFGKKLLKLAKGKHCRNCFINGYNALADEVEAVIKE